MKRRIVRVIIIICIAAIIGCGMVFLKKWRLGRELTAAVYMSDMDRVIALIKQGPIMNVRSKANREFMSEVSNGWTPLHMAVGIGNYNLVNILVSNGADVNARIKEYGFTPLHSNYQFVRNEEVSGMTGAELLCC